MTASVGLIMDNAKKSLAASQLGVATTSHNVANVNTEGYSRQRVDLATSPPQGLGKNQVGSGVDVKGVTRSTSEFLNRRIETENTSLGRAEGLSTIYGQIENVFKDGDDGLTGGVSKFFNDIRSLSAQPESAPLKSAVRESAITLTGRFRDTDASLREVVNDLDRRVEGSVSEANALLGRIANLNARIMEVSARGGYPNDELDNRDMAVKQLAKIMPIQITPLENNGVNIASGRMGVLVNTTESFKLMAARSDEGPFSGSMRVFAMPESGSSRPRDLTDFVTDGELGGYIRARDQVVPKIMEKVDHLAYSLTNAVNDVHASGFTRNGQSGIRFFKERGSLKGAASEMALSDQVMESVANIVTAKDKVASGDNRVLLQIADLEDKKILDNGASTFVDFNAALIGQVGLETRGANENFSNQKDVLSQLESLKEEAVGVSLDEEAVNMIKYQKAFDASAKMIQAADSMLDTVLNLKRF